MKRVYVAGAYSDTNVLSVLRNIGRGEEAAAKVFMNGMAPFTPWHDKTFIFSNWREDFTVPQFYEYSMEWLSVSDAVLVVDDVPGMKSWKDSVGTLAEIKKAEELGIPVFYSFDDLVDWEKRKKVIVCVVGESGTGKSHLASYLEANYGFGLIQSYTDRPKRHEQETGHTFLTKEEFDDLDMKKMIAFTCWKQADGSIGRYCCLKDDVVLQHSVYVIDERGLKYLKKYWSSEFTIFAVRMYAQEDARIKMVGVDRAKRDEGNFNMTSDGFDYFIENDYSEGMVEKYDRLYLRILKV